MISSKKAPPKKIKCPSGLRALEKKDLKADADQTLDITVDDPADLSTDLCKLQNRWVFQGSYDLEGRAGRLFGNYYRNDNQKQDVLYIDGKNMGNLSDLKVEDIKVLAQPSSFGLGTKTVYDENVRKATEIKGDRILLDLRLPNEIQMMAPMGYQIEGKLYKLAIYEKGGFFGEHSDTLHGENHIGTLVYCLPVPHEGGTFVLSDEGNELRLEFDEMIKNGKLPWVSFYTDVKHKVEVVKSGIRMTLQYDLSLKKIEEDYNRTLNNIIHSFRYNYDCGYYYFQEYNQEILNSIKNKLLNILPKTDPNSNDNSGKRKERPDDIEDVKEAFPEDSKKKTKLNQAKTVQTDPIQVNLSETQKKNPTVKPCMIAIMLKRRYGAIALSLDKLKGSDSALYHFLKDDFKIEVKPIILEQSSTYEGDFNTPIEAVALVQVEQTQDLYSSDEEAKNSHDQKNAPEKTKKLLPSRSNFFIRSGFRTSDNENENEKKLVSLVLSVPPKNITELVEANYIEHTGNEAQPAVYSYLHAALFISPKENS